MMSPGSCPHGDADTPPRVHTTGLVRLMRGPPSGTMRGVDTEKFSDRGYKALFSHPRMVEELLRSFVKEDFVDQIDFSTLRREHQTYISDQFREKESDVVWEMQFAGRTAYLYLLLEFQSTVDRCMALRVATYILLFYQDLAKVMSPTVPVRVPRGPLQWRRAVDCPACPGGTGGPAVPRSLRRYLPAFRYYKIAENEFSPQSLQELGNLVAGVFQVETCDVETLGSLIPKVLAIYAREASPHLREGLLPVDPPGAGKAGDPVGCRLTQ